MEAVGSYGFLIFGIGFFIFVMHYVTTDEKKQYKRRLKQAREFGYDQSSKHDIYSLNGQWKQHRKK